MSQGNQSSLRFSLEESLWFRKGQEVDELVSISLSPDITIQENDQYVSIRGALDLAGEYTTIPDGREAVEGGTPGLRYVQTIEQNEEGVCEFAHRFPVDITIPVNRISSIYDIDVIVDSFDYAFPERSCMRLTADLIISGLYDGNAVSETDDTDRTDLEVEEEHEEIFLQERNEEPEAGDDEEEAVDVTETGYTEEEEAQEMEELVFEAEARRIPDEEPVDNPASFSTFPFNSYWNQLHGTLPSIPARSETTPQELNEAFAFEPSPVQSGQAVTQYEQTGAVEAPAETTAGQQGKVETASIEQEESSSSPEPAKKKKSKKKSMSLTEFFARKDDSEEQAKLKVCIVQKGDTLDKISDRYDVSIQNLLRYNQLELSQDVYEGQVLYIPTAYAKK
ncbi:stage VI sporulation protein D [Neobacillus notoginsengisoli]|uniref:Stage VI sporulation protein D n=1 Tax=Neobacillus notoginsengisoli TaxID=1578198 RepID=A0A417YTX9_9BACI|nr:stage VI sporulation protein D [Neobacillus notoginsengisoli]RHW40654.1 stage VI sporulation protein D [Neobacillus notoginsengisoli]